MARGNEVTFRPHHPCSVRAKRADMTDEEFWADVSPQLLGEQPFDDDHSACLAGDLEPCPVCHEVGGCGVDAEGRVLIHVVAEDNE